MASLAEILAAHGIDDPQLVERIAPRAQWLDCPTGTSLLRAGERARHFHVILSGLVRYYYLAPDGKQWNKAFFREGQLVGSLSSFLLDEPCRYSIETLEPTRLISLPLQIHRDEAHPQLAAMLEGIIRRIMLRNEAREAMLLTCNHEARYRWLLERESWLLARVPQYQLASYLSMEPVSFSRIKRRVEAEAAGS